MGIMHTARILTSSRSPSGNSLSLRPTFPPQVAHLVPETHSSLTLIRGRAATSHHSSRLLGPLALSPPSQARSHNCLCAPTTSSFPPKASSQSGPVEAEAPWAGGEGVASPLPRLPRVPRHSPAFPMASPKSSLSSTLPAFSFPLWASHLAGSQPPLKIDIIVYPHPLEFDC